MDIVKVFENIDKLTKNGLPIQHSLEKDTLQKTGGYLMAGFAIGGLLAGLVIAAAVYPTFKNK